MSTTTNVFMEKKEKHFSDTPLLSRPIRKTFMDKKEQTKTYEMHLLVIGEGKKKNMTKYSK